MILALLMAAAVGGSPGEAQAAPAQPPSAAEQAAKAEAEKKFICRREQTTGSRFGSKVCRRKADFEQKQKDDQERLRMEQRTTGGFVR